MYTVLYKYKNNLKNETEYYNILSRAVLGV